jgi:FkbH-like protein
VLRITLAMLETLKTMVRLDGCDRIGRSTRVFGRPLVKNEGRIEIGDAVTIHSNASPVRLTTTNAGTIIVGSGVTIEPGVVITSDAEVRIEDDVTIGPNVTICDRDEHGGSRAIVVERGARIGANARLEAGCIVPRGTIVAPHATLPDHASKVATSVRMSEQPHGERLHALVAADFTIDEIAELLEEDVDAQIAPFDSVVPTLLGLPARAEKLDLVFVWTRPDAISPAFRALLAGEAADEAAIMADVDALAAAIVTSAESARFVFVASWVLPPWRRGLGMLELRNGPTATLMRMNLRLADAIARSPNAFVLDASRWLAVASDGGVDPKLWHAGKIGFTRDVLAEAARDVGAALHGALGRAKKLVVVDLDDTMWGGIVGDVGWEGLLLGGHDARGEAFVAFQKGLVALTRRGIALAVVSKNEETTALEAMRSHPEMIVKPDMLAAHRINWRDKAQNIAEIATELNLGLQSVVFIDDNPVERGRVSEALPEVLVPDWPRDPTHYPRALESLRCFDTPHVSKEDLSRNEMYATERQRSELKTVATSIDEWLESLGLVVRFERIGKTNVSRAAQLLNKTNQMNLRTRRLSEAELLAWADDPTHEAWAVHVADRFGDAGLTGIFAISQDGEKARLEDWLLSCRVMGRRVEDTMLWAAARRAAQLGARSLVIEPVVTKKNKPCIDFFAGAGLPRDGESWLLQLGAHLPAPQLVSIEGLA